MWNNKKNEKKRNKLNSGSYSSRGMSTNIHPSWYNDESDTLCDTTTSDNTNCDTSSSDNSSND